MFVGGLPQEVSQDDLKEYFGQYGEIEKVQLKMDPMTGRSRGFAFLLYKEVESIDNAADGTEHKLKVLLYTQQALRTRSCVLRIFSYS